MNGSAVYAIDVRLPGMVYATSLHSPVHTGQPESWNDADIKKMPGVIATVRLPNGVAIVAQHFEQAMAARSALKATWKKGAAESFNSERALEDYVKVHHDAKAQTTEIDKKGDVNAAFAGAAKTHKAEFRSDYGYHAQMEPLNAVVRINAAGDKAEVWEGSQAPDATRNEVAKALGLKPADVTMHQCYMGGGFGRRSLGDYAAECARIAKEVGRPVKLVWTREEDIAHGMFRPQSFQCLEAAQDASGKIVGWKHCVVGEGGVLLHTGIKPLYYDIPNQHIERRGVSHGIRLKHWRAVGHVFNTFAIESLVDQMAADAGMDPLEFRYQRMSITPKAKKCFETVAQMCDWTAKRPDGRALGVSVTERSGSLGAGVVEISLDRAERQDPRPQGVGRDRRRRHRHARPGQGQRGERHPLRPLQHAARAGDDEGRRRGAVELPRLQPDAHVRPAGGDARRVRRRGHAADRARRDRQSVHRRRDLERVLQAHRQAAAPPAVHARPRAGDAEGVSRQQQGAKQRAPAERRALCCLVIRRRATHPGMNRSRVGKLAKVALRHLEIGRQQEVRIGGHPGGERDRR